MRVGFLELVGRLVHQQFPGLFQGGVPGHVRGNRGAAVVTGQLEKGFGHGLGFGLGRGDFTDPLAQFRFKNLFDVAPHPQQGGVPFPGIVHPFESPVMQFIEHEQGGLQILVVKNAAGVHALLERFMDRVQFLCGCRMLQHGNEGGADGPTGLGKLHRFLLGNDVSRYSPRMALGPSWQKWLSHSQMSTGESPMNRPSIRLPASTR